MHTGPAHKKTRLLITSDKNKFLQHAERCELTADCREKIADSDYCRLEYFPDHRDLQISICVPRVTSQRELMPLRDYFKKVIPELSSVSFDIKFSGVTDLSTIISGLWEDVAGFVFRTAPSCQVWLPAAKISLFNETTIRLEISDETGYYTLKDRQADRLIEKYVHERYNLSCKVFIDRGTEAPVEKLDAFAYRDPVEPQNGGDRGNNSNGTPGKDYSSQPSYAPAAASAAASQATPPRAEGTPAAPRPAASAPPADDRLIYGKLISERLNPTKISTILEEAKNVMITGKVVETDSRLLKTGKKLISFSVTDESDTMVCKIFAEKGKEPAIKANSAVKVSGNVKFDLFEKDYILMVNDVNKAKLGERVDRAEKKRIELHAHSKMSALDGLTEISEFVKLAAKWGHSAVALTDHGGVQGFPEFFDAAKNNKIKPIFGMEGYLIEDSLAGITSKKDAVGKGKIPSPYHIIILAATQEGLKNLYTLVSISHMDYFYKKPRIPRSKLEEYRNGLILGSACEAGELIRAIINDEPEEKIEQVAKFYDYLEIQPVKNNNFLISKLPEKFKSREDLIALNKKIYGLGKKLGLPVCATSDMHYLNPADEIYRKILFAGQKYEGVEDSCDLYFPPTDEMLTECSYLGEEAACEVVIDNPALICARIGNLIPVPQENAFPVMEGAEEKISSMSYETAKKIYGDPIPPEVKTRLDYELNCIISNGFATLYLIAHELVKKSLSDGYLVGSRGSVGSSLVATFSKITEVNPLAPHYICRNEACKYSEFFETSDLNSGYDLPDKICPKCSKELKKDGQKIPFSVFLGFEGDKTPDIDLNFSGEYQSLIHKHVEVIFGEKNVFRAGTISTIADKTAFGFVKGYLEERNMKKRNCEMKRLALGCSGIKKTTGQHPGGIMIIPLGRDIHEFTPINFPANDRSGGVITTHFDYNAIDKKLLKLDLLGHDDPTIIRMLKDLTDVDVFSIPFDDRDTLALFSGLSSLKISPEDINGITIGTLGIPEFGTSFVRGMLEETRPKTFGELVRISGFSHGTDVWLNNAQMYIKNGTAKLTEVISVRDDIVNYLIEHGLPNKSSFYIMENVRKGKGLKPEMLEIMKSNQIPQWYIDSCNKIKYMFPKAHAVAYVMMAFRIAYFKVNYPIAFYATYFSTKGRGAFDASVVLKGREYVLNTMNEIASKQQNERTAKEEEQYTVLEVVLEAMARGIKFYPVELYESDSGRFKPKNNDGLLCPFSSVGGLGDKAAQNIFEESLKGPFVSVEDFKDRTKASKTVIEILENLGTLKTLPKTDQLCMFD